ncbi:NmrA family transcriptional regulator [Rhodococcus oryzae]|uniref:NmrA family transcriptional regulator n=1 Tax=Rhodococcus oryzae TaxID=2571143 RepID=A0ABY2RJC7_9NOCA|nr:NmrA family transcriptional regulator [Rhodococcus oryzae]TJZ77777.1 NmrA family transcriptional regulator [Rhodococcus oryzae]
MNVHASNPTTLVLGGTGKTGRRVAQRLTGLDLPVRLGTRSGGVPFDWEDTATWEPALEGMTAAYISYYPDLAAPGAVEAIASFSELAVDRGVRRLVLLSGRGEVEAQACEKALTDSGADTTILRASWFAQNFSEGYLLDPILAGQVYLPAGDIPEPFVDVEDIADVALTALTQPGHTGEIYELTGPRAITFAEAVGTIATAAGRTIDYVQVPAEDFAEGLAAEQVPADVVELLMYLFTTVLDGRNAEPGDGVRRALGRAPRDFAGYASAAAATGIWNVG